MCLQGHFIEVQVSDGALYRTRLYCYSLDQSRVVRPLPTEKNYHIFYQVRTIPRHEADNNITTIR